MVRASFVGHAPFAMGVDEEGAEIFVRFIPHNEGEGFRAFNGHRTGWIMLIGVPLDYRNTRYLSEVVGTFGQFIEWDHNDRRLVRSLVHASYPDNALVPRDVVFREFSPWGGTVVSWTAAIYILTSNFAEAALPADEDPMPSNGNPHPMPGHFPPNLPAWGAPPYPVMGWNEGAWQQQNQQDQGNNVAPEADEGWQAWDAEVAADNVHGDVMPPQDQISIENNSSVGNSSSSDSEVIEVQAPNANDHEPEADMHDWAIVPYSPPVIVLDSNVDPVQCGPALPPEMVFLRTMMNIIPAISSQIIPKNIIILPST